MFVLYNGQYNNLNTNMNYRNLSIALIIISLVTGTALLVAYRTAVRANSTTISVTVGPPVDVCPNIPGMQTTVPDGMEIDTNGDCVTPPPPPIDLCDNIPGNQSLIPDGYYRDDDNNCFLQPTPPEPPVDVCPNLPNLQTSVPDGYINDSQGNCIIAPVDQCDNIGGLQPTVPEGMIRNSAGVCFTPVSQPIAPDNSLPAAPTTPKEPASPWQPPTEPRQPQPSAADPSQTTPANTPTILSSLVQLIIDAIPGAIKDYLRSLPPIIAQTFPYYIFSILAASAGLLWVQAAREAVRASTFVALLKRERSITEQKDNFIALASHYLRTPLTIMSSGIDTVESLGEVSKDDAALLRKPIISLQKNIESILAEIRNNEQLHQIQASVGNVKNQSFARSWHFWTPILISVGLTLLANFMLGVVGEVEIGTLNLVAQFAVLVMVVFFFYSAFRNHQTRKRNRLRQEQLIANERVVDNARNRFLERTTTTLQKSLVTVYNERIKLTNSQHINFFDEGYVRFLGILDKFSLLAKLRTGEPAPAKAFNLKPLVGGVIMRHRDAAKQKGVTIVNNLSSATVKQQRDLLEFVFDSLIDNAIKFTDKGGTVTIDSQSDQQKITVSITDTGAGIPADKQSQLFKPFSRTESAVDFNYEGLGFSLFLDRIIMDYLDGDISFKSQESQGSTFSVTLDAHIKTEDPTHHRPGAPKAVRPTAA